MHWALGMVPFSFKQRKSPFGAALSLDLLDSAGGMGHMSELLTAAEAFRHPAGISLLIAGTFPVRWLPHAILMNGLASQEGVRS